MTETLLPMRVVDEDVAQPAAPRRALLLVGGALASLALGGGALLLFTGGEELPVDPGVVRAPRAAAPAVATAAGSDPHLPAPFEESLGRDPFRALYVQPAPPAPAVPAADPTLGKGTPTGSAPAPSAPANARPTPSNGTPTGAAPGSAGARPPSAAPSAPAAPAVPPAAPAAPTAEEHRLILTGVTGEGEEQTATFTIDGKPTTARVGTVFGPTGELRLVSVQEGPAAGQWTAVLQVGDGEPFDVVTGQAVSVR